MFRNRETTDSKQLFSYYEMLGFTKEQCQILSLFEFNDSELISAITLYNKSSLMLKGISFVKSLSDFIDFYGIANKHELLTMYMFKLTHGSKFDNLTKVELVKEFEKERHSNSGYDIDGCYEDGFDRKGYNKKGFFGSISGACYSRKNSLRECECECKSVSPESSAYMPEDVFLDDKGGLLESTRYDKYQQIEEKGFLNVLSHPTSTFRTNCNTASLDNIKVNIKRGYGIEKSMVRAEELLNYFNYDLEDVKEGNKFGITVKMGDKPNSDNKMILVGIKGENVAPTRQNIVFLLDASGSMSGREKQMQLTMMTFIAKLNKGDKFSLITYSDDDITIIDDITFDKSQIDSIIERIFTIKITGCTNGSGALNSAYDLIESNKIEDGINRVVIMTDGDFNFGDCSTDSVEKLILEKKKTGAYLSVIGTGTYNTDDELMETLAKNGNGNYCIVNYLEDVEENIYNKYNKLMFTIATDVKAQIEFNPKYIKSYRLIGYENRTLNHEDFRDDKVIAEPYGCGNYSIALYEVEMNDKSDNDLGLKYQKSEVIESDELCNVSVRYKELGETESKEESKSILYKEAYVDKDPDLDLAYSLFVVAENLRKSEYVNNGDVKTAKLILKQLENDKKYTINDSKLPVAEFLIE